MSIDYELMVIEDSFTEIKHTYLAPLPPPPPPLLQFVPVPHQGLEKGPFELAFLVLWCEV